MGTARPYAPRSGYSSRLREPKLGGCAVSTRISRDHSGNIDAGEKGNAGPADCAVQTAVRHDPAFDRMRVWQAIN